MPWDEGQKLSFGLKNPRGEKSDFAAVFRINSRRKSAEIVDKNHG